MRDTIEGMSSDFRPEGFTSLTPFVVVSPAREAVEFYRDVFDARVTSRVDGPDGTVMHAELDFGCGRLQLMDPAEQFHTVPNDPATDEARFSIGVYVPDVDAVTGRARQRGARVREEPTDFDITGDRFSSVQDPYGVRWSIMTRTTHRTDEEIQARLDAWVSSMV